MPQKRKPIAQVPQSAFRDPSSGAAGGGAVNLRYEPSALSHGMDVDRVHSILRSAESGDTRNLFSLYRDIVLGDAHLQAEFAKRKLAVLGDAMTFQPFEANNQPDADAADAIRAMVSGCKNWRLACAHLLDSCLYPVALVEKVFAPLGRVLEGGNFLPPVEDPPVPSSALRAPRSQFALARLVPVPHYLLDFTSGAMRIYDVAPATGEILSTTHEPDPTRYIVHHGHILSAPDNWGGPMRSLLFWWLLSAMDREWWARFLDRYGAPFLVGTYDRGDKDSRSVLERAFALSVKLGGLVVADGTRVEIKEAAAASTGEAYERFLSICQREKSKLILGQTLSAEAQPTGLGSGVSKQQETVRQDIRKFDATMLSETLRDQLIVQYLQINSIAGRPPAIVWGADTSEESRSAIDLLTAIRGTDAEFTDEALAAVSARTGLQLRRRQGSPALPVGFAAQEVGAVHPFAAQTILPRPRRLVR